MTPAERREIDFINAGDELAVAARSTHATFCRLTTHDRALAMEAHAITTLIASLMHRVQGSVSSQGEKS